MEKRLITGFELNLPKCANVYGSAPCEAAIGVTGEYKCFNSPASCQDPINYLESDEPMVLRWVKSAEYVDLDVPTIPSLTSARVSSMQLNPGSDIGQRETATINFSNHSDNDFYLDPYVNDRDYNPYFEGDFWSKFDERYPNIQGYECKIVRGFHGQLWDEMEKSHYIVEKGILSGNMSSYTITARDVFMLLQNKKSQIPRPCDGFLRSSIGTGLTPFQLDPPGIGDFTYPDGSRMYPATGYAFIGDEYFRYSISGDIVTPISRGLTGTEIVEHEEGESMQVVEVFQSMTSSQILQRILDFTAIDQSWYNVPVWDEEVSDFDNRLYSGAISEPVEVDKVLNELINDLCLTIYPDVKSKKIVFEYIRDRQPVYEFNDGNMMNISRSKSYDKRVSAVYIRFGRFNPLLKMDENTNYRGRLYRISDNMNEVLQKNSDVVHSQYSRFIPINLRDAADDSTKIRLGRFGTPPRVLDFTVDKDQNVKVGQICSVESRYVRDSRGMIQPNVKMQIIKCAEAEGRFNLTAEEFRVNYQAESDVHIINVIVDQFNINLRTLHDSLYSDIQEGDTVKLIIDPNIKIGGTTSSASLAIGNWPNGVRIEIHGMSSDTRIQGKGGNGGTGQWSPGAAGSTAIHTTYPIHIYGNMKIWGGGGGAGGIIYMNYPTTGGGGAGYMPGNLATIDRGGGGFTATPRGGDPGQPGTPTFGQNGGPAGRSIDGVSLVTFHGAPDIRGPQVN